MAKGTKKSKALNFGLILLLLAALVNLPRWTGLFVYSENAPDWIRSVIPILDAIGGLFAGLSIAGGLAFVSHRLGSLQPFTPKGRPVMRFWGAVISLVAILVLSAFLLPPYIRMTTPADLRAEIHNLDTWSIMSVLVGDLIIVAVALADGKSAGFTRSSTEPKPAKGSAIGSAKGSGRSSKGTSRSAKDRQPLKVFECPHTGAGCSVTKPTQEAINAHAGRCKFKPTISMPKEEAKV